MKYSFISGIEKAEAGGIIKIPFNVWEICKKEGKISKNISCDSWREDFSLPRMKRFAIGTLFCARIRGRSRKDA